MYDETCQKSLANFMLNNITQSSRPVKFDSDHIKTENNQCTMMWKVASNIKIFKIDEKSFAPNWLYLLH